MEYEAEVQKKINAMQSLSNIWKSLDIINTTEVSCGLLQHVNDGRWKKAEHLRMEASQKISEKFLDTAKNKWMDPENARRWQTIIVHHKENVNHV